MRTARFQRWLAAHPNLVLLALGALVLVTWCAFFLSFPLPTFYRTPLLDLAKLALRNPQTWFVAALGIALLNLTFLAGYRLLTTTRVRVSWWLLLGVPVLAAVLLIFTYPIGAADLFDYLALGHVTAFHGNSYVTAPAQFADNPFVRYAAWPRVGSAYGPLWELFAAQLARFASGDLWRGILLMKAQAVFSFALATGAVAWLVQRRTRNRATTQVAVFLIAWNPLLLFEFAANGHNDLWIALSILAAVVLAEKRWYALALPALIAGALIKFVPLLLVPIFVFAAVRTLGWRRGAWHVVLGGALSAGLIVACYAPFWPLADPLRLAQRTGLFTTSFSSVVMYALMPLLKSSAGFLASRLAFALLAALMLLGLWRVFRSNKPALHNVARDFLAGLLLLATAWFQAWYVAWVWPLAASRPFARAVRGLLLLNTTVWFKYLFFSLTIGPHYPPRLPYAQQDLVAFLLVMGVPLFWHAQQALRLVRWRKNHAVKPAVAAAH